MIRIKANEGRAMVRLARRAIESHFKRRDMTIPAELSEIINENLGVFVTLRTDVGKRLRGQIGYTDGVMHLSRSLPEVAESAAFRDHRFSPLRRSELRTTSVEVSVLTRPELIVVTDPWDYEKRIEIGRHGLIVRGGRSKGIFLPQIAVEKGWGPREFLSMTCIRAQLEPDSWKNQEVEVYTFEAETFAEDKPCGKISRVKS